MAHPDDSVLSPAGTSKDFSRRQLRGNALPGTDGRPCFAPPLLPSPPSPNPTAPALLPSWRLTPGPAGAGTGASNWKGELQSTKSYQQAAGESSAAILREPSTKSGAGWQPFVRWHGADTHGCSCSEWALPWLKWGDVLPGPRRAAREWETGTAQRSGHPRLPGVFWIALGTASWPLKYHQQRQCAHRSSSYFLINLLLIN